jgi:hypothetical protein
VALEQQHRIARLDARDGNLATRVVVNSVIS